MKHLTFDQIVDTIYSEDISSENDRRIADVNAHVMKCPKCFEIYKAVYGIYELGFDQGIDVVQKRLKELEQLYGYEYHGEKGNDSLVQNIIDNNIQKLIDSQISETTDLHIQKKVKKYLTQITIDIENSKKIVLNNIKNMSLINYDYIYAVDLLTNGEQQIDTSKLIDDDDIDNYIDLNDGELKIQFSKNDYDEYKIPYPSIEILTEKDIIYDGPMDQDDEYLFKIVQVDNVNKLFINITE